MNKAGHPVGDRLISPRGRSQKARLAWAVWGILVIPLCSVIGVALISQGWATPNFTRTVLWCTLPYLIAAHLSYESEHLPRVGQRAWVVVITSAPFVLMPLVFALLQAHYSRGAILLVGLSTTFWFVCGLRGSRSKLTLAYVQKDLPARLHELMAHSAATWPRDDLVLVDASDAGDVSDDAQSNGPAQAVSGLLLDPSLGDFERLTHHLVKAKSQHIRMVTVQVLAESLSGRLGLERLMDLQWQPDPRPAYDLFKRLGDFSLVLIASPIWVPLCILIGTAVKMESAGPMFFTQYRTGLWGKPFRMWKFRTMRHQTHDTKARFAGVDDDRITRVGKFLRKSRLDELPQFFNVLLGHMSLIGPRPEQAEFVREFSIQIPSYPYRHLVRPGISGWAQVNQGYVASTGGTVVKLSYDLYYVVNYGFALDLLIAMKTLNVMWRGDGAR
jgi:lipopolysaccharide/colanic/teichoic acid biosynthesis glycosyltransferase